MPPTSSPNSLSADTLIGFAQRAFMAVGLPEADAQVVAGLMVEADLVGADAHGIFRLPQYIRRIEGGAVNRTPRIRVDRSGPATALLDGDNGMGHLVMRRAADQAILMASEAGLGWVGVRGSNHAGPASIYAAMPLEHGMVGIYSAVASANHMAPWGGTEQLLGTNPLAIAIPAGDGPPVVLDMATTVVSYGTVKAHALRNEPMPEGWMIDRATGAPLTDPNRANEGVLLPVGGYKGAGLAMMLGLLAGTLNGAGVGRAVVDFNADSATPANTGQFILALDVARFMDPALFGVLVQAHGAELRAADRLPGVDGIRLPGDERARRRAARVAGGVPIGPELLALLEALGVRIGIGGIA